MTTLMAKKNLSKGTVKIAVARVNFVYKISTLIKDKEMCLVTMTQFLLKYSQEHHLPRFDVALNLKSVHCSWQRMKLFCKCNCT